MHGRFHIYSIHEHGFLLLSGTLSIHPGREPLLHWAQATRGREQQCVVINIPNAELLSWNVQIASVAA